VFRSCHVSLVLEGISAVVVDIIIGITPGQGNLIIIFPGCPCKGSPVIWCSVALTPMVEYLGLILSEGCMKMDPVKVIGMDWPTPRNVTEVQLFI